MTVLWISALRMAAVNQREVGPRCVLGLPAMRAATRSAAEEAGRGTTRSPRRTTAADLLGTSKARGAVARLALRFLLGWLASCSVLAVRAEEKPAAATLVLDSGGHTAIIRKVLFTPDGRELITVADDKTIRLWDVASGQALRVLRPPIGRGRQGTLFTAALSPDGSSLATGGYGVPGNGHCVFLIDVAAGAIQRVLKGHENTISSLAFAPDGRRLASGSFDQTARLWDVASGQSVGTLAGHAGPVSGVAFSPDGKQLATASYDRTARIWSLETHQALATLAAHTAEVKAIAWSVDNRTIVTGGWDQNLGFWNSDGKLRRQLVKLDNQVQSVCFSPDSRTLVATTGGPTINAFYAYRVDVATGRPLVRFSRHNNTVHEAAVSPDGMLTATSGGDDSEVYLWKADGTVVSRLVGRGRRVLSCGWSREEGRIAWGNTRKFRSFSDYGPLERGFDLSRFEHAPLPADPLQRAVLSRGALSLEAPNQQQLLIKKAGQVQAKIDVDRTNHGVLTCFSFVTADIVAVGTFFQMNLYDARSGERVRSMLGHTGTVWAVAPTPDARYFLTASADQTLRIWDPQREEPVLSLFFAGQEWIAWTPEGYYSASPGGERLVGWHVNNGPERMASYYPAAQFRKSLYRPDVVQLLMRTGSTARGLEVADEQRGRATQLTRAAEVLPPEVVIDVPPRSPLQIDQPRLQLQATATPKGQDRVTALRVLVDGRPVGEVKRPPEGTGSAPVQESWSVPLDPGKHQVVVKAETDKSYSVSPPVEVTYAWQQPEQELPALYVVAVGISAYQNDKLRLNYGAADARGLVDVLKRKAAGVYRSVEEKLLVDGEATQRGILRGLDWLRKQMTQRDVGVVFFAGHGAKDDQGMFYLVPVDCTPDDLSVAGVGEDQIKRFCQSIPGRLLLLMDACHTGALGGDKRRSVGGLTDNLVRDLITDDYGVVVMCSSMGREESREQEEWGHGAFTKALIEGLEGQADFNRDRSIYLSELDLFVTDRVKQLTNGHQHPVTQKPTTIRSFPLARP